MHWDAEAMAREFEATQPIQNTRFFLGQLSELVAQANALRAFFECEHAYRWAMGADLDGAYADLQRARREVVKVCGLHRGG
jgi:hypothetical protein